VKHIIAAKKLFRKQIGMSGEKITIKRLRDEVAKAGQMNRQRGVSS
jgi:hypothetical protein